MLKKKHTHSTFCNNFRALWCVAQLCYCAVCIWCSEKKGAKPIPIAYDWPLLLSKRWFGDQFWWPDRNFPPRHALASGGHLHFSRPPVQRPRKQKSKNHKTAYVVACTGGEAGTQHTLTYAWYQFRFHLLSGNYGHQRWSVPSSRGWKGNETKLKQRAAKKPNVKEKINAIRVLNAARIVGESVESKTEEGCFCVCARILNIWSRSGAGHNWDSVSVSVCAGWGVGVSTLPRGKPLGWSDAGEMGRVHSLWSWNSGLFLAA